MTQTLEATTEQRRLAEMLHKKRQREIERVAREIEADRKRAEREAAMPTKERLSKGGLVKRPIHNAEGFVEAQAYVPSFDIQALSKSWSPSVAGSYELFVKDATKLGITHVTMNYGRIGASVSVGTFGIAIDHDEDYQQAADRHDFIMRRLKIFDASGDISVVEVLNFILCYVESVRLGTQHVRSWADVGRLFEPGYKDEASSKGHARGALNVIGRFMAGCYLEYFAMYGGEMRRRRREVNP